jgi:prepilin-type N-terminal cleavage/methylation domain-containing protein
MTNKNKLGFSLIELSVVMAIMFLLGAAIAPRYSAYKKEKSMSYARTQLANDIRYAQTYTLSTRKFPDGTSPTGGFGIHFQENSDTYTVFGDKIHGGTAPNHSYTDITTYPVGSAECEFFESVKLVEGIKVTDIQVIKSGVSTFPTAVDYVSVPPYGKIYIDGTNTNATLRITFSNGSRSEFLTITSSGFIS